MLRIEINILVPSYLHYTTVANTIRAQVIEFYLIRYGYIALVIVQCRRAPLPVPPPEFMQVTA